MSEAAEILFSELASLGRNRNRAVARDQWMAAAGYATRMDQTARCAILLGLTLPPLEPKIEPVDSAKATP